MLAEEGGSKRGEDEVCWIVDPLDDTTNYAHGLPVLAVSIALESAGEVVLSSPLVGATCSADISRMLVIE